MEARCIASVECMQAGQELGWARTAGADVAGVARDSVLTEGPGAGAIEGVARGAAIGADMGA